MLMNYHNMMNAMIITVQADTRIETQTARSQGQTQIQKLAACMACQSDAETVWL